MPSARADAPEPSVLSSLRSLARASGLDTEEKAAAPPLACDGVAPFSGGGFLPPPNSPDSAPPPAAGFAADAAFEGGAEGGGAAAPLPPGGAPTALRCDFAVASGLPLTKLFSLLTKPGGRVSDIKGGGKDATPKANNALLDIDSVRVSSLRFSAVRFLRAFAD
jgi:hypothetical protein